MLALSTIFGNGNNGRRETEIEGFYDFDFDLASGNLLDNIDFDDLFTGIGNEDLFPDLEMDPDEFSASIVQEDSEINNFSSNSSGNEGEKAAASVSVSDLGSGTSSLSTQGEEIFSKPAAVEAPRKEADKRRKSSVNSKNPTGKKKLKVDWTPELHRRFVQAVEQLGVDKAVPSRILELMGLDSLTRHNIASHLQKYRSHRRHLLAREADAASWTQRRQMYAAIPSSKGQKPSEKRDVNRWIAPTMGFPPVTPPMPHFRPLHVWGHPSVDQSFMHMWPKHLTLPPQPYAWPPAPHPHFFPPTMIFHPTPTVPRVSPMSNTAPGPRPGQTLPQSPSDVHPSKESVDAAIGDVLSKPWQPLPLGLKPPSVHSVMQELQTQGISKIPPTCA